MDVLNNWERWKEFLGSQVDKAQAMGISEERITDVAAKMGDYLASKIDPRNEQEALLKQLWDNANEEEQHTLASLMVKMTQKVH
jgi:Protein of unknown function (DUF3243)